MPLPSIFLTVTNDLSYDQRMIRICTSLAANGNNVTLVGRKKYSSVSLVNKSYAQKRLNCFFEKGKLFYAEYNTRLFFYLLFKKMDCICAVDVDTILPCYYISKFKKVTRIIDSHEYFSQQKEVITRPGVHKIWHWVEKKYLPKFSNGYTVSNSIAAEFKKLYNIDHEVIRNMPLLNNNFVKAIEIKHKIILYQGAVNEARGLEYLIPAMRNISALLHIYGNGNFMEQVKELISTNNLQDKVFIKGMVLPEKLDAIAQEAYIGINLVQNAGLNQYYSLANKFFDYIHNGLPQVTMNFPEYKKVNEEFEVAVLIADTSVNNIESAINNLLADKDLYRKLKQNCAGAKKVLNWQQEEKKLLAFYKKILG